MKDITQPDKKCIDCIDSPVLSCKKKCLKTICYKCKEPFIMQTFINSKLSANYMEDKKKNKYCSYCSKKLNLF